MIRWAGLLFLLLLLSESSICKGLLPDEVLFSKGKQLLLKGNYEKALNVFEQLQLRGVKTPALFGNMAVAYFKTNEIGKAVLYNEKALLLSPFDSQLRQNKTLIKPSIADAINSNPENTRELRSFAGIGAEIAFGGIGLLLIGSLVFFCWSLNLIAVWKLKVRRTWQILISSGVFFALFGWLCVAAPLKKAVVMTTTSEARIGPGKLAKVVFELKEGEEVELINNFEKWDKIKSNNGSLGWVPASEISIIQ